MHEQDRNDHDQSAPVRMLRERDLAKRWNFSRRTLQRWRAAGYAPPHHVIGGAIRYRLADVVIFEEQMKRGGKNQ